MAQAGEYVSYQKYYDKVTGANIDFRTTAELMAELDEVDKLFEREDGAENGT